MQDKTQQQDNDVNIDELKSELELAQKKSDEHLEGWQRAKADYLNLKKDTEKRQVELIQFANAALIAELLPIFDHFKLALKHVPDDQKDSDWVIGFFHIKKQFDDFLKNLGIEEIKTVGEKFDPEFHEAVVHEENQDFETDVIFEEVKSGYTLHGKVIMPAKVKVAK
ncbi:MAG: nucleotide exchange factor GrpE [Patescibacteria group bacterium]|jgi:molecular chaperone GrpE